MSGKRMGVSIAFSRNSALGVMSRQYVVQFQLGTTRLSCTRENAANNGVHYTVLYATQNGGFAVYFRVG